MSHKANDIITDIVRDFERDPYDIGLKGVIDVKDIQIRCLGEEIDKLRAEVLRLNILIVNAKAKFDDIAAASAGLAQPTNGIS